MRVVEVGVVKNVLATFEPVREILKMLALDSDAIRFDGVGRVRAEVCGFLVLVHLKLGFLVLGGAVATRVAH